MQVASFELLWINRGSAQGYRAEVVLSDDGRIRELEVKAQGGPIERKASVKR